MPCGPSSDYRPKAEHTSVLRDAVAAHFSTFANIAQQAETQLPGFVQRTFERLVGCGDPAQGFARFRCGECRAERFVPLSCKGRGLCPSCGGRRMSAIAQHVVDAVVPHVPVRQWVLSLPYPLRYRLAYDPELCGVVLRTFARALNGFYKKRAAKAGHPGGRAGAVTFIQRFGSALNLNVHFHTLAVDGTFHQADDGTLRFEPGPTLHQAEVDALVLTVHKRVLRALDRRGLLEGEAHDSLQEAQPVLAACYQGALGQRLALGPERGRPVMRIGQNLEHAAERIERRGLLQARLDGFDLHGRIAVGPEQRKRLERLVRYCARPPVAQDRLSKLADGRYLYSLKTPWYDGTTHVRLDPIELMERLAALIPRPRVNQVVYQGVLAPAAKGRADIVAYGRPTEAPAAEACSQSRPEREQWAQLMRRSFGLDVLSCDCGGRFSLVSTILNPRVAARILAHLRLQRPVQALSPPADTPPFWPQTTDWVA